MQYFVAIRSETDCSEALEAARRHSPNIEIVDETTLVFDVTGSKVKEAPKIAKELWKKFAAVAVSENLAAALLLARWGREEFKVQSSKFKVKNAGVRSQDSEKQFRVRKTDDEENKAASSEQTLNFEPGTLNLPPDDELFRVKKSEYRAGPLITSGEEFNARVDRDPRRKPQFKVQGSKFKVQEEQFKVQGSKFKVQEEQFKVQGSKFKVRKMEAEAKESSSSQQTSNAPKAPTLNFEPGTLNQLPIEAISRKAEFLELMDSWAIHDLGAFSQLPEDEMVERFGLEIIELRKQAAGEAFRVVNWNVKEDKFFWAKELEGAIETIEPLNFVLSKGVAQIFRNLDHVGLSTQSAKITLRGRKKKKIYPVRLVFPTKNQKIWIRQIVTKIELDLPGFNIDRVEIEFRVTKPRTVQNNLYSGAILEPENLNLIVSKLKKVVGIEKIGLPKLRDSWSDPFYMTEDLAPLIREEGRGTREFKVQGSKFKVQSSGEQTLTPVFYYMPQPVKARVFFESGEPKALIIKGKRELVRTSGGPWRKDAEWYRANGWKRDEWDIETESGAVYRVFVDKTGEAFVDGGYD